MEKYDKLNYHFLCVIFVGKPNILNCYTECVKKFEFLFSNQDDSLWTFKDLFSFSYDVNYNNKQIFIFTVTF